MDCHCGHPDGSNPECERCRLIAQRDESLDALRELHDFAQPLWFAVRSARAFLVAKEILSRYGK